MCFRSSESKVSRIWKKKMESTNTPTITSSATPEFDHQRHAVGGAGGGEEEAVFHRQKADHLGNRLAARDHHEEGEQHAGECDAEGRARHGAGQLRDRQRQIEGEDHQHDADQHGGRDVDHRFHIAVDVELFNDAEEDTTAWRSP